MPDGSLVCVMLTGGPTEPHRDNFTVNCKSRDVGKTWSLPKKLFSHKSRGVWCTEIYTGFDRPMLIVHTYNGECPYKELQTFVSYTDDNGETWSNPVSIAPYANGLCVRKGIKMSNGETLFPIYHTHLNDGFGEFPEFGSSNFWLNTYHSCGVIISADEGKSYMPYSNLYMNNNSSNNAVDPEGNFGTSLDLWEPNCVEVESGHIVM